MDNDRGAVITVGGKEYQLVLSTRATKEIGKRYGGLENLGDKILKPENFELAMDEITWLITMLANQSILAHNLQNPGDPKELLTEEMVDLLTTPLEIAGFKDAIMEAMVKGTNRHIESEGDETKKRGNRVNDEEAFTRLYYYGTVQLGMSADDFWLCPLGLFMDLWECHKQYVGIAKPKEHLTIDEVFPAWVD